MASLAIYVSRYKRILLVLLAAIKGHGSLHPILIGTTTGVRYVVARKWA